MDAHTRDTLRTARVYAADRVASSGTIDPQKQHGANPLGARLVTFISGEDHRS